MIFLNQVKAKSNLEILNNARSCSFLHLNRLHSFRASPHAPGLSTYILYPDFQHHGPASNVDSVTPNTATGEVPTSVLAIYLEISRTFIRDQKH